nr:EOG090X04LH [Triops cancriformis]
MESGHILKGSIQQASYNIVLQVAFRVVTFLLNAFILHYVSQDVLGIINVRLVLLFSTILFVSREAFRRACLSKAQNHNWPQVINLIWLTVPNAILWSSFFGYIWLNLLSQPDKSITQDYSIAVCLICLSCVVEAFGEPIYLFSQAFLYIKWRLVVDCLVVGIKTLALAVAVALNPDNALKAFAYSQLCVSSLFVLLYAAYFHSQLKKKRRVHKTKEQHPSDDHLLKLPFDHMSQFLPTKLHNQPLISYDLAKLTWSFFKQGILKQVLTEGERYIMTIFGVLSFAEQGVYDVVNNLGSMAARFIFLPIEESGYFYFAQMIHRDAPIEKQSPSDIAQAAKVLKILLRGMLLIGLTILTFGFAYSHLLLQLYGGHTLSESPGPTLLRTHCACVLLLALNGVTEAYIFAAMSHSELDRHNKFMVALSCTFLLLSWGLSNLLGSVGFILANCANMALRIAISLRYIHGQYSGSTHDPLKGLIPHPLVAVIYLVSFFVTATSERVIYPVSALAHVGIGGICLAVLGGSILKTEPDLTQYLMKILRSKLGLDSKKTE